MYLCLRGLVLFYKVGPYNKKKRYTDQRKKNFSLLLREKFSHASCFGSDKSAHTSSADQTWVITWKIIGDSSWSNKRGGDSWWSNKRGGDRSWFGSLSNFSGKKPNRIFKVRFIDYNSYILYESNLKSFYKNLKKLIFPQHNWLASLWIKLACGIKRILGIFLKEIGEHLQD